MFVNRYDAQRLWEHVITCHEPLGDFVIHTKKKTLDVALG